MGKFSIFQNILNLLFLVLIFFMKDLLALSCSFDDGLCGWRIAETATGTWMIDKGIPNSFISMSYDAYSSMTSSKANLLYPNFTGSGFLSFSYCQSGSSKLNILVGNQTVISLKGDTREDKKLCVWKYATITINSSRQEVRVEGITTDLHAITALDEFLYFEEYVEFCNHLSPVPANSTMNCTLKNHVTSICRFQCNHASHVIRSYERRCLPSGRWSGLETSCQPPQIRLKEAETDDPKSVASGKVEVLVNGSWQSLCRKKRYQNEMASVVCRSLGLGSKGVVLESIPDKKRESAWVVIKKCNGSESHILDCERSDIARHSCSEEHVLHVICGNASCPSKCECTLTKLNYEVKCSPPVTNDALEKLPYYTTKLTFNGIDMSNITKHSFSNLEWLNYIKLTNASVKKIDKGIFRRQKNLVELIIDKNIIQRVLAEVLPKKAHFIVLRENRISFVEKSAFESLEELYELDLRYNNLRSLSFKLPMTKELNYLYLGHNMLWNNTYELLKGQTYLFVLDIMGNHMDIMRADIFQYTPILVLLFATKSNIQEIEDKTFQKQYWLSLLFLDGNQLRRISRLTFYGADYLEYLSLANNPLNAIEHGAFQKMVYLQAIYLIKTKLHTIGIGSTFISPTLTLVHSSETIRTGIIATTLSMAFILSSGYECTITSEFAVICFPCDQGYYKINAFDEEKCQKCPPGGFYQDEVAHVGEIVHGLGCKQCPVGSYVKPENAPGKAMESCSACLEGTNFKRLAGFKACPCLDNFYRLDRFGKCMECPLGYQCANETISLLPEFYWVWKDERSRATYQKFSKSLQDESNYRETNLRRFNETLPKPYLCPFIGSCKGGLYSRCADGYEGTLCAVCSKGFYRMFSGCHKCPNIYVFAAQCIAIVVLLSIIALAVSRDKKAKHEHRRSVSDTIFSSFKIVIGFYQVTSGTLNAYSYIQWPEALSSFMKFADVVQLNIFKLVPIECLRHSIRLTPYIGLVIYLSLDAIAILLATGYFYIKKAYTNKKGRSSNLSKCKANCYRAVFLFLFVTYPATCEKVFQVLPASCNQVCNDQQDCSWFLQSDYSIRCYTGFYNRFVIFAYFALLIPFGFPIITIFLLWKYCRNNEVASHSKRQQVKEMQQQKDKGLAIALGMRFIYENYSPVCWYWEVIELTRKVIFTSVLVYSGQEGRLFLGVTAIFSGFYAIFFAYTNPIPHSYEKWLHLGSLVATMANQFMTMLLKIPAESVSTLVDVESDSLGITIMLMLANLFVIIIITVRYMYGVIHSVRTMRKNPQCGLTCILSLLQIVAIGEGHETSFDNYHDVA